MIRGQNYQGATIVIGNGQQERTRAALMLFLEDDRLCYVCNDYLVENGIPFLRVHRGQVLDETERGFTFLDIENGNTITIRELDDQGELMFETFLEKQTRDGGTYASAWEQIKADEVEGSK